MFCMVLYHNEIMPKWLLIVLTVISIFLIITTVRLAFIPTKIGRSA